MHNAECIMHNEPGRIICMGQSEQGVPRGNGFRETETKTIMHYALCIMHSEGVHFQ